MHGHWGRPVIWFPSESGAPWDFEANGMLDAVRPAIDDARITVFCVPSFDSSTAGRRPGCRSPTVRATTAATRTGSAGRWCRSSATAAAGGTTSRLAGPSMGAFHAVLFALRHPHVFGPRGRRSRATTTRGRGAAWGPTDDETYFASPFAFLPGTHGGHLDFLRSRVSPHAGGGQRDVGGQHGCERVDPRPGRRAGGQGHPARAVRVGARVAARLAELARARRRIYLPALG